jgi:uncharacterized protein
MIHLFKNNGYNIVLDVNSSSVHVVDDVVYDVLSEMKETDENRYREEELHRIAAIVSGRYPAEELTDEDFREIFDDIRELEENGTLFTDEQYLVADSCGDSG